MLRSASKRPFEYLALSRAYLAHGRRIGQKGEAVRSRRLLACTLALSFTLAILLLPTSAVAQGPDHGDIGWWTDRSALSVKGSLSDGRGVQLLNLEVSFQPGVGNQPYEALKVYVGDRLVLAHVANDVPGLAPRAHADALIADGAGEPFMLTTGPLAKLRHRLAVPLTELSANPSWAWVAVRLRWAGRDFTIAQTPADLNSLGFTTTFEQGTDGVTDLDFEHCCSGGFGNCGRMCIECTGAFFYCNLIDCYIECIEY